MKFYSERLVGCVIENEKMIASTYDNVISFDMNDFSKPPVVIANVRDIVFISLAPNKSYIVACDSCGVLYQISLNNEYSPKKIKLKNKPNAAYPFFINNKKAITADWNGNVFCVDFERGKAEKILTDEDIDYCAVLPSVDNGMFLLQGLKGDCDAFIKKCNIINDKLNVIEINAFGETALYNHQLFFKRNELIYFIDKINNVFYLLSYNEITKNIIKCFPLHQLNELEKSMTYYVDLEFCSAYQCFVVAMADGVQVFNLQGKIIQNISLRDKNTVISFSFIHNDMIYIATAFGLYAEKLFLT